MHVKKDQEVKVLTGKDKGKTGKIIKAFPKEGKILVEGVNIVKKHQRATKKGSKGQTIEKAMPINASNVVLKK
ncbi:MAG: 50S ribosomal protein L24 [bacterium]|nr:50S ribosomal protein L24 [bacterium]